MSSDNPDVWNGVLVEGRKYQIMYFARIQVKLNSQVGPDCGNIKGWGKFEKFEPPPPLTVSVFSSFPQICTSKPLYIEFIL